jgi:hypothetical protein
MEKIATLNQRLIDYFGKTDSDEPIWRIIWSDDQYEKRLSEYTIEGLRLIHPKVQELPKYSYVKERYILERLVLVPEINQDELPSAKISYEPMWVWENNKGNFVYPSWQAIEHVISCIYAAIGKHNSGMRYKDPDAGLSTKDLVEKEADRIRQIQEDLFGNETDATDALSSREGVIVPFNYKKEKIQ